MNDTTPPNFGTLLKAVAQERDVSSFEVLFRHFGPRVKSYLLRQVKNRQVAEELMQETMMTVWNKAALFDDTRGNVSAWIFTIARNLCITSFRKQNRPEFDPNDPAFVPDETSPADLEMVRRQEAVLLAVAVDSLPEEQRNLIKLAFYGDMPHTALAEKMALPLGTVKSRIRIAIAKLRKSLGDQA